MKQFLAYVFYISITFFITEAFHFVNILSIQWSRFIAADRAPGDISMLTKYLFSFGVPAFYFACTMFFFFCYRAILKLFSVKMNKAIPICVNIIATIYIMISFYMNVFDLN